MPAPQLAPVNPRVLVWARQDSGWAIEDVAKKLAIKVERLQAWESGEKQPTVRQVQNLAKFLHRPLSTFFQPNPPDLPPLAGEYRRLPDVTPGQESPLLRLALRQMINRRQAALDLFDELGDSVPAFRGVAHLSETPAAVGQRLRQLLGLDEATQLAWTSEWQAWRAWRAAVEAMGVLVFQFTKVELEEVRGLSLLDAPLPVVGINSKERVPEAKAFTLLHEVVHLMLAAGHEELPALKERRTGPQWLDIERFAESAASHALLPEALLQAHATPMAGNAGNWTLQEVRRLARRFWITPLAMATRLRESGLMSWGRYHAWRSEWRDYVSTLPKRGGGFATPAEKTFNRYGRPFVQLVLEAMSINRITSVDAARYLDLKFQHFDQLKNIVNGPASAGAMNG
ncbi:MAG: helix-turn-helix domain-containing protein [Polaromonas sp.]|nr:helix-turn-helix domain-containing protein [Polaromonas sp.]